MSSQVESISESPDVPEWVDTLLLRKMTDGFEPRHVVILPDQPVSRSLKMYEFGVYDYDGDILPHDTDKDRYYARISGRMATGIEQTYGLENVDVIPLPSNLELLDKEYPRRMHRLVMVRKNPVWKNWIQNALSDGPRSPSEAARPEAKEV